MAANRQLALPVLLILTGIFMACGSEHRSTLKVWNGHHHKVETNLTLYSFDSTPLKAHLYTPYRFRFPGRRPVMIFINSWTMNEFEYTLLAKRFAEKGFIVLSYASRGFGGSGGMVQVASRNDVQDTSTIIDWLLRETRADPEKIYLAGVSYGGGIALLASAYDERIKGVASMSAWADLIHAMYEGQTIKKLWLQILIGAGQVTGRLDPELAEIYTKAISGGNLDFFFSWANARSAKEVVDKLEKRCLPLFLSNNYQDNLFFPNQMMPFFNSYDCQKKHFYINHGIHATSEIKGILGFKSLLWDAVIDWFESLAYGEVDTNPQIAMEGENGYEFFSGQSVSLREAEYIELSSINPLIENRAASGRESSQSYVVSVKDPGESGATTGFPIVAGVIGSHTSFQITKNMEKLNLSKGIYLLSEGMSNGYRIRGIPRVNFKVRAHSSAVHMIVYLYEVDPNSNKGTLLSHGMKTMTDLTAYEWQDVQIDFRVTFADIKPESKLAVVIDSYDTLYHRPDDAKAFDILHDDSSRPGISIMNLSSLER